MPNYISTGDWFVVTQTEQASVEAGTVTKASIVAQTRKKKD